MAPVNMGLTMNTLESQPKSVALQGKLLRNKLN